MQLNFSSDTIKGDYLLAQPEFREALNKKKTAPRYVNGKLETSHSPIALKHERLDGPFTVAIFGGNEYDGFEYKGAITVEEDEYAYVYRDSLTDGYMDAYFCDDNTLLMDVRNKSTREKTAIKIDNEPTGTQSWDWSDPMLAGKDNCFKTLVEKTITGLEADTSHKVYGVIQLNP